MDTNDTAVIQPLPPTPLERHDALLAAREVLLVKAGRYAERALDVTDLLVLAEFILDGNDLPPASLADFEASVERIKMRVMEVAGQTDLHLVKGAE